ncbi:hypothetical protein C8J56DRAFT_1110179 [Mycena floridula]|nr:hypothetical protein C8J56DRAFT_1110179 [Mycena floridula]
MAYFVPVRTSSDIVLYLSSKQPTPGVPFELQGSISPDVWATRLPAICTTAERYSKPMFERIWLILGFIATLVVPIALYSTILASLHITANNDDFNSNFNESNDRTSKFIEARAIVGGITIGLVLLFTVPIMVWKFIGRSRVNSLLRRWEASDRATIGNNNPISQWKVKTPGFWSNRVVLRITLPANYSPTAFHPSAYLPSYLNGPPDAANDAYFYPYKPEPGMPRMSVVGNVTAIGNVPLYTDEKRGFENLKV